MEGITKPGELQDGQEKTHIVLYERNDYRNLYMSDECALLNIPYMVSI